MLCNIIILCLFVLCSCSQGDTKNVFVLPEGSICVWNDLLGLCININNCPSAKDAIQQKNRPQICSFEGKTPIVCCKICEPARSTTNPITDCEIDSRFNRTSKARDNCIKYVRTLNFPCNVRLIPPTDDRTASDKNCFDNDAPAPLENTRNTRSAKNLDGKQSYVPFYPTMDAAVISHGHNANKRQYPHMALLGYGNDLKTAQWMCGGSVISDKFILTAGHCISSPAVGQVKFVALGILNRSDPPELWQTHSVKRIIGHPEYQPPSKYNDIALLETENTISFNTEVLPACLPLVPEANEVATATGWGALGHRQGLADTLQAVDLVRYDAEKCSQLYPKHRLLRDGYNHTTQMCYGDTEVAKDTCEGDSGGPLQTRNEFAWCAYTVLGVTSYGRQCGVSAGSGMYIRVYHYVPWIESQVWP
ncbi:hypothetical protein PYW08_012504 [Mythimna loreyi]|uniref:Uncharacterized protein n=1 Tax=Mythimna loreyi TaxID=667449 RepID=A0ACC2Q5G6_9NEOP|nr:hypothetical protein PYW08_012504 [Mythimna loreyi]